MLSDASYSGNQVLLSLLLLLKQAVNINVTLLAYKYRMYKLLPFVCSVTSDLFGSIGPRDTTQLRDEINYIHITTLDWLQPRYYCGLVRLYVPFGIISLYSNWSGLLHWHWAIFTIAPAPGKPSWRIWVKSTGARPPTKKRNKAFIMCIYSMMWLSEWFSADQALTGRLSAVIRILLPPGAIWSKHRNFPCRYILDLVVEAI